MTVLCSGFVLPHNIVLAATFDSLGRVDFVERVRATCMMFGFTAAGQTSESEANDTLKTCTGMYAQEVAERHRRQGRHARFQPRGRSPLSPQRR